MGATGGGRARTRATIGLAVLTAMASWTCAPALAGPPAPVLGATCAVVLDPATHAFRYTHNPDRPCWTGSTAKTVTIDVAIRAYRSGYVGLNSVFGFSEDSTEQLCTCLGTYADDTTAAQDHPDTIAVPHERIGFRKALFGADMSAVEPTVSLAEYVANSEVNHVSRVGQTVDASEKLRVQFVGLMNNLFSALGLHDSHFANEHGGAEPLPGLAVPKSTAREMAEFWDAADVDPLFVKFTGLRDEPVTTTLPGGGQGHYTFRKWYGYYPHILGDKEGGVTPPGEPSYTSLLGSSRRLGRTLIFDDMEDEETDGNPAPNEFTDAAELLRYGFAKIFDPVRHGASGNAGGAAATERLACWGDSRCVTASAKADGKLKVTAWKVSVGHSTDAPLGSATGSASHVAEVAVATLGSHDVCGPPAPPQHPTSRRATAANRPGCAPAERVVTGEVDGGNVVLRSWDIRANATPTLRAESGSQAGTGTHLALVHLTGTRFASAVVQPDGKLRIDTWKLGHGGAPTKLASATTANTVASFAMTPEKGGGGVITETILPSQVEDLERWAVASDGTVARTADTGSYNNSMSSPGLVRTGAREYMTSAVIAGKPVVEVWELAADGASWARDGSMVDVPGATQTTETTLARLGMHAPLLVVVDAGKLHLRPMDYDTAYEHEPLGPHDEQYYTLGDAAGGDAADVDVARLSTTAAQGDFVTAVRTSGGRLRLSNWRVGAHP